MNQEEYNKLKNWFNDYCDSFITSIEEDNRNIEIKRQHTREVCLIAKRIAQDLRLSPEDILLAEAVALFHDVGRFPQYREFKTYRDSISVNHAALGAKVLLENNVLRELPEQDRDIIVRTVTLHNVFKLPDGLDENPLLFSRLVRDADKLDIFRVAIEYYRQSKTDRPTAVGLGLSDDGGYSADVLAALMRREMVLSAVMKTMNDFKLQQLAWIYDLNFASSLRMVVERDTITKIAETLPVADEIARAVELVREYVRERLAAP